MEDYKLKVVLAILSAVVFSMIFIIMAFVTPLEKEQPVNFAKEKPKNRLEEISKAIKDK